MKQIGDSANGTARIKKPNSCRVCAGADKPEKDQWRYRTSLAVLPRDVCSWHTTDQRGERVAGTFDEVASLPKQLAERQLRSASEGLLAGPDDLLAVVERA